MKRRAAEQGMEWYEAAKRRWEEKDRAEAADALVALVSETEDVVYPINTVAVATQTDLKVLQICQP